MDWSNHKLWRKKLSGVDKTTAEFNLLVQGAIDRIVLSERIKRVFDCSKGHPILLKSFLRGEISPESMVIYEKVFSFLKNFDKNLLDPVWEIVSLKIKKYSCFIHIDVFSYKRILREIIE